MRIDRAHAHASCLPYIGALGGLCTLLSLLAGAAFVVRSETVTNLLTYKDATITGLSTDVARLRDDLTDAERTRAVVEAEWKGRIEALERAPGAHRRRETGATPCYR